MVSFDPQIDASRLRPVVQARILYADTDAVGIVYHAAYFRYLELARVELLRAAGLPPTELGGAGLALPLVELGVRFCSPGRYDDRVTILAGLVKVTQVRVWFQYRVVVEPGDRLGEDERMELLRAETRHCCVRRQDGRPARIPASTFERLRAASCSPSPAA